MTVRCTRFKAHPSGRLRLEGENSPSSLAAAGSRLALLAELPGAVIPHFPCLGASAAVGRVVGEALGKLVQESTRP